MPDGRCSGFLSQQKVAGCGGGRDVLFKGGLEEKPSWVALEPTRCLLETRAVRRGGEVGQDWPLWAESWEDAWQPQAVLPVREGTAAGGGGGGIPRSVVTGHKTSCFEGAGPCKHLLRRICPSEEELSWLQVVIVTPFPICTCFLTRSPSRTCCWPRILSKWKRATSPSLSSALPLVARLWPSPRETFRSSDVMPGREGASGRRSESCLHLSRCQFGASLTYLPRVAFLAGQAGRGAPSSAQLCVGAQGNDRPRCFQQLLPAAGCPYSPAAPCCHRLMEPASAQKESIKGGRRCGRQGVVLHGPARA